MKSFLKSIKVVLAVVFFIFSLLACRSQENDDIVVPKPEQSSTELKWSKVEFRFTEGHSHGYFHGSPEYPDVKYLKSVQKFFFENKNGQIVPSADNPAALSVMSADGGLSLYGLEIFYYNEKGERINSVLASDEAAKQYQHFFLMENIVAISGGTVVPDNEIMTYKYRDTNPENKYIFKSFGGPREAKIRPEKIGLKGFFDVKKPYLNFDLRIVLAKFGQKPNDLESDKLPSASFDKELDIKIPVHIYTDRINEDSLVKDAAREFGVSEAEIEADIDAKLTSDVNPESSGIFL